MGPGAAPGGRAPDGVHRGRVAARRRRALGRDPGPRHARGDHPGPGDLRGIRRRDRPALRRGRQAAPRAPEDQPGAGRAARRVRRRHRRGHSRGRGGGCSPGRCARAAASTTGPCRTPPTRAAHHRRSPASDCCPSRVAGDHFNPSDPNRPLKVLPPAAPGTPDELVLNPGDAPAPGQYVVHGNPTLALPYLPDPLAVGVSLAFLEAGSGRHVAFPWGAEQVTARYPGTWPVREPFVLTLASGAQLGASIEGRGIGIQLPPGDVQTFRLASSVQRKRSPWFGVWRSLDDALTSNDDVREAAADGLLWSLTPGEEVRLVHAVPRPVSAPRPTTVKVHRIYGSVLAALIGGVEVHGPSTDKLATTLAWTDLVDDLTLDGPVERTSTASGLRRLRAPERPPRAAVGPRPDRAAARLGGRGAAQHHARAARHQAPPGALPVPRVDPLPGVLRPPAARARPDEPGRRRAERRERGARDLGAVDGAARRPEGALGAAAVPVGRDRGARAAVRTPSRSSPRPADLPRSAVELERRRRAAGRAAGRRRRRQPGLPAAQGEHGRGLPVREQVGQRPDLERARRASPGGHARRAG